jgi:hypothetical protein
MKTSHIFWGILFMCLGVLILLNNFDWLVVNWSGILKLWPFIFILWGLSMLAKGTIVKNIVTGVVAMLIALTIFASFKSLSCAIDDGFVFYSDDEEYVDGDWDINTYSADFSEGIKTVNLTFDAGAGTFVLRDTAAVLFNALTKGKKDNYELYSSNTGDEAKIRFKMKKNRVRFKNGKLQNSVEMKLNSAPVWDINFDVGAASAEIDLSKFKVKKVDFDMGAASLHLKLGKPVDETKIIIDAGASSININIPEGTACEVRFDGALTSKSLDGFKKIDSDLYRTSNFYDATEKFVIKIDSGVSSVDINRYPN